MLMLTVFLACLASVLLAGGKLRRLSGLQFRATWLCLLALAVQVLVISVLPASAFSEAAHVGSYVLIAMFLVANHRLPGLRFIALGAVLNFAAISANGGVMPARAGALEAAGMAPTASESASGEFANSAARSDARLAFLGDVFALPRPWVFANVFSIGDVIIGIGAAVGMHSACGSRLSRRRRHGIDSAVVDGLAATPAVEPGPVTAADGDLLVVIARAEDHFFAALTRTACAAELAYA